MTISANHLVKSFAPGSRVVDGVSFTIEEGEMFFLLGPSGCGKTTILRMLAGFVAPDSGDILFGAKRVNDFPPQERNTAMVFQNYALWPHLSVFDNIAYGPRARKLDADSVRKRVESALRIARLESLAQRKPAQLSGGQQQRVALARALAVEPGLILLDVPLSNLDARLRLELRSELRRIHADSKATYLYVTHDQEEALSLADRIAVMHDAKIAQIGSPREIYERPVSEFVARFMGEVNLFAADSFPATKIGAPIRRQVAFRPESVILAGNGLDATVLSSSYLGNRSEVQARLASGEIIKLWVPEPLPIGSAIHLQIPPEKLMFF